MFMNMILYIFTLHYIGWYLFILCYTYNVFDIVRFTSTWAINFPFEPMTPRTRWCLSLSLSLVHGILLQIIWFYRSLVWHLKLWQHEMLVLLKLSCTICVCETLHNHLFDYLYKSSHSLSLRMINTDTSTSGKETRKWANEVKNWIANRKGMKWMVWEINWKLWQNKLLLGV